MSCLGTSFWCTPRKPDEVHEEHGWQASANVKYTSTMLSEVESCLSCHYISGNVHSKPNIFLSFNTIPVCINNIILANHRIGTKSKQLGTTKQTKQQQINKTPL